MLFLVPRTDLRGLPRGGQGGPWQVGGEAAGPGLLALLRCGARGWRLLRRLEWATSPWPGPFGSLDDESVLSPVLLSLILL